MWLLNGISTPNLTKLLLLYTFTKLQNGLYELIYF